MKTNSLELPNLDRYLILFFFHVILDFPLRIHFILLSSLLNLCIYFCHFLSFIFGLLDENLFFKKCTLLSDSRRKKKKVKTTDCLTSIIFFFSLIPSVVHCLISVGFPVILQPLFKICTMKNTEICQVVALGSRVWSESQRQDTIVKIISCGHPKSVHIWNETV